VQGDWDASAYGFSFRYRAGIAVVFQQHPKLFPVAALTDIENVLLLPASIQYDISTINSSPLKSSVFQRSSDNLAAKANPERVWSMRLCRYQAWCAAKQIYWSSFILFARLLPKA
jgi:hypothetical protein